MSGIMVVRMRHTRAHTGNRRSHHALKAKGYILDPETGHPRLKHRASAITGVYKGRKVAALTKKLDNKIKRLEKKTKEAKK